MTRSGRRKRGYRIGVVLTRLGEEDGVSLETSKWIAVLGELGHECFTLVGAAPAPDRRTRLVPEMDFRHAEVLEVYAAAFSLRNRPPDVTRRIQLLKEHLKERLYAFVAELGLDLLLVENALAIPLNIPLGLAITEFVAETGTVAIAHHHDMFWERQRFLTNCAWDYLNMAFPPHLPSIHHVVINTSAANQLSLRTGISATLIPNVMDFERPPPKRDAYSRLIRGEVGLREGEFFFLQPTRVVARKGIEHAIELVRRLGLPARLVISHASGDEGYSYERHVRLFAELLDVPVTFVSEIIRRERGAGVGGRRIYALSDAYLEADLVTYPSTVEGFGNAFLEAVFYRRPILVNNYSIYATDIRPKGFRVVEFDGHITEDTITQVRRLLGDPSLAAEIGEHNFRLGRRHYSFGMLRRRIEALLEVCLGEVM
jgi:glycosyltransferase involved in cell wall biosynthesis